MLENKFENMFRCTVVFFGILLLFGSCSQKTFDTREELTNYLADSDNGYIQHKNINGIDFSVTYRPTDMLVEQELAKTSASETIDSLRNKYKKYMYFNISLSKNGQEVLHGLANNRNDFGGMVNQLAFSMGDKVNLYSSAKDTIPLADYIYPRLFGMGGATSMLFVYPRDEKVISEKFFHITIEDIGLNTGEVGFKIPTELIKNEPNLKLL